MLLFKVLTATLLPLLALAHEEENQIPQDGHLSLPKLVDLTSYKQLTDWEVRGSASLDRGRLLLTPERNGRHEGSIWNKNYKLSKKSFSIDLTFRALGAHGKTGNGLVLWLLNDAQGTVERLVRTDTTLYGGPSKFDGFALVVDTNGPLGSTLRGYVNDNTKQFNSESPDFYKQEFGKCIIGYQDSQVPATIRVSYDDLTSQFRVSIDNKICFETNKFKIPEREYNFVLGASAKSGANSKREAFEIFKLSTYETIVDTEQKYNDVELAAQPVIITKNAAGEITGTATGVNKQQQQQQQQQAFIPSSNNVDQESINKIFQRLSAFDNQLSQKLSDTLEKQKVENSNLHKQIQQLASQNDVLEKYLKEVDRKLHSLVLTEQDKKIEKENYRKESSEKEALDKASTEKLFNRIKTFIYVLVFLILALGSLVYRIRSEIKHAKLL